MAASKTAERLVRFANAALGWMLVNVVLLVAVVFVPHQEDYGFVTAESFASGKPVITCADSGGPLELVRSRENGLVTAPDPDSLARACLELTEDAALAERLGARGHSDVAALTWADAVKRLVIA